MDCIIESKFTNIKYWYNCKLMIVVMTTPMYEFLQLLMTGIPGPSMDKYLQQELRRHGLRRWDKSAKSAYDNMQRVAFECLLPACERLDERYKTLNLQESHIYVCINTVGNFLGALERLFLVIKSGKKQFHEFENWLEHILEILQPTIRESEDQVEDPIRSFPPINYKSVSEFLKSGLTNKDLNVFFQADENTDPQQDSTCNTTFEDGVAPSYPVVYPFSEELQSLISTESERQKKKAKKVEAYGSSKIGGSNSPFSGAAMAAALKSRGFNPPPNPPPPKSLFSASKGQPASMQQKSSVKSRQQLSSLTLKQQLGVMTKRSHAIFNGPSKAVARSIKVSHTLSILNPGENKRNANVISGISKDKKLATRYCYHDLSPWHYLAFYLSETEKISVPTLCILRTRNRESFNTPSITRTQSPFVSSLTMDDITNMGDIRRSPRSMSKNESKSGISALAMTTRLGQKRRTSNPDALNLDYALKSPQALPLRASLLLETPSIETLSLRSPRKPTRPKVSDTSSNKAMGQLPEFEIIFYSLQEHGFSGDVSGNLGSAGQKMNLDATKGQDNSYNNILDITFLDDHNLGIILDSPSATNTPSRHGNLGNTKRDRFLISVPLQTSNRPYFPVSIPQSQFPMQAGPVYLFDYIDFSSNLHSSGKKREDRYGSPLAKSLAVYTLPIDRSRCVMQLEGNSIPTPDTRKLKSLEVRKAESSGRSLCSSDLRMDLDDSGPTKTEMKTTKCYRIASNERENRRVVSVHSIQSKESTSSEDHGNSTVTVFEL
ncbi:hypothetical protein BGZ76_009606 [Entomortierella beljakovae]|nr:hypothetical protein BGZ76_009606 [Entomortierella beljakovae]